MSTTALNAGNAKIQVTASARCKAHVAWLASGVPLKPLPSEDYGIKVCRAFLNSRGRPLAANRVESSDLVQVQLTISSAMPLRHVVVEDLLAAGLEIENPRLTTASDAVDLPPAASSFVDAKLDMRDDRLVLIGDLVAAGGGTFVYTARAVTAGSFVLPPVHATCMYDTAINSLADGGRFEITAAGSPRIANLNEGGEGESMRD